MKRILAFLMVVLMMLTLSACARKEKPTIKIKYDSVSSIVFKRMELSDTDATLRTYYQKKITGEDDVKSVLDWICSLSLLKHEAIEVPSEKIEYLMKFGDTKEHVLIFFDDYVVYDSTAYTFKNPTQQEEVIEKYNLLNYEEQETELDLF